MIPRGAGKSVKKAGPAASSGIIFADKSGMRKQNAASTGTQIVKGNFAPDSNQETSENLEDTNLAIGDNS